MRMNTLSAAALVGALSLASFGTASAAQVSDSFNIDLTVQSVCFIDTTQADISMIMALDDGAGGLNSSGNGASSLFVVCNKALPYVVEVDAYTSGEIPLVDASTNRFVTAHMKMSEGTGSDQIWGKDAFGEAFASIGTGTWQTLNVHLNYGDGYIPAVGFYTAQPVANVIY